MTNDDTGLGVIRDEVWLLLWNPSLPTRVHVPPTQYHVIYRTKPRVSYTTRGKSTWPLVPVGRRKPLSCRQGSSWSCDWSVGSNYKIWHGKSKRLRTKCRVRCVERYLWAVTSFGERYLALFRWIYYTPSNQPQAAYSPHLERPRGVIQERDSVSTLCV